MGTLGRRNDRQAAIDTTIIATLLVLETAAAIMGAVLWLFYSVAMSNKISGEWTISENRHVLIIFVVAITSCFVSWKMFASNRRGLSVLAGLPGALIVPLVLLIPALAMSMR